MGEVMSAKSLHHRETDPAGSDFRNARLLEEREIIVKRTNGGAKVLMIIGASVISVLFSATAFLIGRDRAAIDEDFAALSARTQLSQSAISSHEAQLAELRANQAALASDLAELKKITEDNNTLNRQMLQMIADLRRRQ